MMINKMLVIVWLIFSVAACSRPPQQTNMPATVVISFSHMADGKPIRLDGSMYQNGFGEVYSIKKLKYYISNVSFTGPLTRFEEADSYHLVDASKDNIFQVTLAAGNYTNFEFLIGVDSLRNCSGAQSGALDPLNDMFWTWNSGYVSFKLEGTSPQSTGDLNRIEHHIGGYKSPYISMRSVKLVLPEQEFSSGEQINLSVSCNLDNYWKSEQDIRISEMPVNIVPGPFAVKAANNYQHLFSIVKKPVE